MPVISTSGEQDWFTRKAVFHDLLLRARDEVALAADREALVKAETHGILDLPEIPDEQARRLAVAIRSAANGFRTDLEARPIKSMLEAELIPSLVELEVQLEAFLS